MLVILIFVMHLSVLLCVTCAREVGLINMLMGLIVLSQICHHR